MKIFEKDYSSEELSDLSRDIYECFDHLLIYFKFVVYIGGN